MFNLTQEISSFDYCTEALSFQLNLNREFNRILFEQMEQESAFVRACIESTQIILEETQPPQAGDQTKKSIFQKIIGFLKHVYKLFVDKTQAIIERNKEWMDANASKLDTIDYGGLQIEMIPFWTMGVNKVQSDSSKLQNKIITLMRNNKQVEKYKDLEAVKNELFGEYLDENGDLTNGLKNYMRVGNAKGPLKTVTLRDNQLKDMATKEFRTFCTNYGTAILPFVKRLSDEAQRQLAMIERSLASKTVTKEAFCLIENAFYSETEVGYYTGTVVLEAEQPAQNNNNANSNQKTNNTQQSQNQAANKQKVSATKVQITDHGSKERAAEQEALNNLSSDQLVFFKNVAQITQLSTTALMTAMEERYSAYMNAMKQIVSARGAKKTKEENNNQDQQKNEPEKKPGIVQRAKNAIRRKK